MVIKRKGDSNFLMEMNEKEKNAIVIQLVTFIVEEGLILAG